MHTRIRPDWPVVAYKFAAWPTGKPPKELWSAAEGMREAWNKIVEMKGRTILPELAGERRKLAWKELNKNIHDMLFQSHLTNSMREELLSRYQSSAKKTLKPQTELRSFRFSHRYTSGGIDPNKLTEGGRAWRFQISSFKPGKQFGFFGLTPDCKFQFKARIHRPVFGIVKQVAWSASRHPITGKWRSWLIVTTEVSPVSKSVSGLVAGLDLGWRLFEGFLRVGMVVDSAGNAFELRLPIADTGTAVSRRRGLPDDFYDLLELDSEISTAKNEARMDDWRRLRSIRYAVRRRLIGRTRWLYGNLAAWLVKNYSLIVWEGNLSIKRMAEHVNNPAIAGSMRYRHWAAIGDLRRIIANAVEKSSAAILDGEMSYSTVTCSECGETMRQDGQVVLECPNRHRIDQDFNASLNLLSQTEGLLTQNEWLRSFTIEKKRKMIEIPNNLQAVVVPVHSE